jgi:hypothetical protein
LSGLIPEDEGGEWGVVFIADFFFFEAALGFDGAGFICVIADEQGSALCFFVGEAFGLRFLVVFGYGTFRGVAVNEVLQVKGAGVQGGQRKEGEYGEGWFRHGWRKLVFLWFTKATYGELLQAELF